MTKIALNSESFSRAAPHNLHAEQLILGAVLINNDQLNKVTEYLKAEHFYQPVHKRIFTTILNVIERGVSASPISLKNIFDKDEDLKEVGGWQYLNDLVSEASTIIDIRDYGKIIYELALRRKLIDIGEEIVNDAFKGEIDVSALKQLEAAEAKLFQLATEGSDTQGGFLALKESLVESINRAQKAFQNSDKVTGITSGFLDMDSILGGFQDSDLLILAGRPSMGKTAFSINLAVNAAKAFITEKYKNEEHSMPPSVGFFSLEMSGEQLASRMISMQSGVNASALRTGKFSKEEFGKLTDSLNHLNDLPFFIDDTPALSITAIRTRARRLKRKSNLAFLIIDYLQLIRGTGKSGDNRVQEVSEITQGLKAIAKELNIPIIALSQLSRAVEQREDKRPLLSDLRESGSIEQDADIVMFIYREEYYELRRQPEAGTDKHALWMAKMEKIRNISEIIIAKHRNGPVGNVKLFFDDKYTKFGNYTPKEGE